MALEKYRKNIDEIDFKIIELLSERFEITEKVGEFKAKNQLPAKDASREAQQYLKIQTLAQELKLDEEVAKSVFKTIIDSVVENHKKIANQNS